MKKGEIYIRTIKLMEKALPLMESAGWADWKKEAATVFTAIHEEISKMDYCVICGGFGSIPLGGNFHDCDECKATGRADKGEGSVAPSDGVPKLSTGVKAALVMKALSFVEGLKSAPGKCGTYWHGNESGKLWEKLWIFEGGSCRSKVCASGVFVDWETGIVESEAITRITEDFRVIAEA